VGDEEKRYKFGLFTSDDIVSVLIGEASKDVTVVVVVVVVVEEEEGVLVPLVD